MAWQRCLFECVPKVRDFYHSVGMVEMNKSGSRGGKKNLFMGGQMNSLGPPSSMANECFRCPSRGCTSNGNMKKERGDK